MHIHRLGNGSSVFDSQYQLSLGANSSSEECSENKEISFSESSDDEIDVAAEERYVKLYDELDDYERELDGLEKGASRDIKQNSKKDAKNTVNELEGFLDSLKPLVAKINKAKPAYLESLIEEVNRFKAKANKLLDNIKSHFSNPNRFYIDPDKLIRAYDERDEETIEIMHSILMSEYSIPTDGGLTEILPLLDMRNLELFPNISSSSKSSTSTVKCRRSFERWLWKPVYEIKNDGEEQSKQLQEHLVVDLNRNQLSNLSFLAPVRKEAIFSLWRYFSHNCTYDPPKGYGLSSEQDRLKPLTYRRSQPKNVPDKIGCSTDLTDLDKLYLAFILGPNWRDKGLTESKKRHIGLIVKSHGLLEKKLEEITMKLASFKGSTVPKVLTQRFLSYDFEGISIEDSSRLDFLRIDLKHRASVVKEIVEDADQSDLKNLKVFSSKGSPNVSIQILPSSSSINWDRELERRAWVDTCLTFFAGLLNRLCIDTGLLIATSRRQSFGFLRPTVTDVETTIRLSVGCVPQLFSLVVGRSIRRLDQAITKITEEGNPIFKIALIGIEAPLQGVKGNFFVAAMRKNQRVAFLANDSLRFVRDDLPDCGFSDFIRSRIIEDTWKIKLEEQDRYNQPRRDAINEARPIYEELQTQLPPASEESWLSPYKPSIIQQEEVWEEICQVRDQSYESSFGVIEEKFLLEVDTSSMLLQLSRLVIYLDRQLSEWVKGKNLLKQGKLFNTFSYCFDKLYSCYDKGKRLVTFIKNHKIAITSQPIVAAHCHSKAHLLVEKILENIIAIKSIDIFENIVLTPISDEKLCNYFNSSYDLDKTSSFFFRTISGQSALSLGLAAASRMVHSKSLDELATDQSICLVGSPYYEVEHLLEELRVKQRGSKKSVSHDKKITLVDPCPTIKNAEELQEIDLYELFSSVPKKGVLIVDVTNIYLFSKTIRDLVFKWRKKRDRWLIFASSLLKHEQMGADKFQAGRLIILKPNDELLDEEEKRRFSEIVQELGILSARGINPVQESFLSTIQEILYPLDSSSSSPSSSSSSSSPASSSSMRDWNSTPYELEEPVLSDEQHLQTFVKKKKPPKTDSSLKRRRRR